MSEPISKPKPDEPDEPDAREAAPSELPTKRTFTLLIVAAGLLGGFAGVAYVVDLLSQQRIKVLLIAVGITLFVAPLVFVGYSLAHLGRRERLIGFAIALLLVVTFFGGWSLGAGLILKGNEGSQATGPDGGGPNAEGGATETNSADPTVLFLSPPQLTQLHIGGTVQITGSASGLRGKKLWFLTQSSKDNTYTYYFVTKNSTAVADGPWSVPDSGVGTRSDIGGTITYYPIVADMTCDSELSAAAQGSDDPSVLNLPPTCKRLPGFGFAIVA